MANAHRLMEKYKDQMPMFNDDIQGTGAVALAALLACVCLPIIRAHRAEIKCSAIRVSGMTLQDQRIIIYGAGSAGMGIADQIKDGLMILEGLSEDEALKRFWCVDKDGLLLESMGNGLRHSQLPYARADDEVTNWERESQKHKGLFLMDGEMRSLIPTGKCADRVRDI